MNPTRGRSTQIPANDRGQFRRPFASPPQEVLRLSTHPTTYCQPASERCIVSTWWHSPPESVNRSRTTNGVPSCFNQNPKPSPGLAKFSAPVELHVFKVCPSMLSYSVPASRRPVTLCHESVEVGNSLQGRPDYFTTQLRVVIILIWPQGRPCSNSATSAPVLRPRPMRRSKARVASSKAGPANSPARSTRLQSPFRRTSTVGSDWTRVHRSALPDMSTNLLVLVDHVRKNPVDHHIPKFDRVLLDIFRSPQ